MKSSLGWLGTSARVSFANATALAIVAASATLSITASAGGKDVAAEDTSVAGHQLALVTRTDAQQDPTPSPQPGGSGPQTGPTVTLSGGGAAVGNGQAPVTAADTPADVKQLEKKDEWIDKWAGSSFFTQASANLNVFFPKLQQTRNPTVEQWSSLSPRYAITKDWQLRGRIVATYEYTNSDETARRNDFRISDTTLQLFYRGIPTFLHGTKVAPALGVAIPTSPESRARSMVLSPSLAVQVAHNFEHVLGGALTLIGTASYAHPFYRYTTGGIQGDPQYPMHCYSADGACSSQLSGTANTADTFSWVIIASGEWGKFSPGVLFWMTHARPYEFKDQPGVDRLADRTALRQSTYFGAWLDYQVNDWLTPEVGYQFSRSVLDANGSYGNPIFSQYQDMRVYVGFNVGLDSLYKSVIGKQGEAGVVRASNKRPIMNF